MTPAVDGARLRSRLEALATIGADPDGITRLPYTEDHARAVRLVASWMREAALVPGCDAFGNVIGHRPGEDGWPTIVLGSHLDSVPHGGTFDGALGVVAAIEVAQALAGAGTPLRHAITVVGFADEEGVAFGRGTLASRLLVRDVLPEAFDRIQGRDGRTLAQALAAFDPGLPRTSISPAGAYLELHIEQGPVLDRRGLRVASVTAITGMARATFALEGEANHAGTTPMSARRDALVGAADIILAVKTLAEAAGPPVVATVGLLTVAPGATNIVPGRAELTIEIRSPDRGQLEALCRLAEAEVRLAAASRGLTARGGSWDLKGPVPMDPRVRAAIVEAIADAGQEAIEMPSGAGHDAMILAPRVPAGMIFVPSRGGISHSPREWTDWEDVTLGAGVLLKAVARLDADGPLTPRAIAPVAAAPAP